jgi:hypothetical protein
LLCFSFVVSAEDRNATATRTEEAISQGNLVIAVVVATAVVVVLVGGSGCKEDSKDSSICRVDIDDTEQTLQSSAMCYK